MAAAMRGATFCWVPEGDSPETSRLFDAVAALCVPLVLSDRLPVPPAPGWTASVLVLSPGAFLRAPAAAVVRRLELEAARGARRRRCKALLALRAELQPRCVVERVLRAAERLVAGRTREERTMAEMLRPVEETPRGRSRSRR